MRWLALIFFGLTSLVIGKNALAQETPLALVWAGPGTCYHCPQAAAAPAKKLGMKVVFIRQGFNDWTLFSQAKVWIQPGGNTGPASQAMGDELLERIRDFVNNGGGYVGYCAGAFLAGGDPVGERIDKGNLTASSIIGLNILPGTPRDYSEATQTKEHQIIRITTEEGIRSIYYAGGPYFDLPLGVLGTKIIAQYPDGKAAAILAVFGRGRVSVVGPHPEADWSWALVRGKLAFNIHDSKITLRMTSYAAGLDRP